VARSSGASGIPTRVAWVRVEGTPWSVAVGRYESSLMQAHWVHLAWIGASAFTLLAIGTAVAYAQAGRIRRAVRSLAEMAAAAGTGTTRLPPAGRLGVEEFSAVQAALGASVERLNKRSAERDAAEAKLREADQRKDEFLAMLAHELRNPLAPVLNGVRLLLRREPLDESGRRVVEMVERQTLHMKRLVDDLLEVSRITRGQIDLRREPMELNATIEQVIDVVRPGFEAKGVTLSTALPATPVHIVADPVRLQQILENLLSNAGKFTPRGGTVRIEAAMLGDMAEVRVIDDGAGIAEEKLDRIFELFQQADPSFDRAEGGLGIGLAMVRRLAKLHGGSVQAESAGRGQGATFVLRLPCSGDRRRAARGAGEGGELAAEPGSPDQRA
jgi:signal transduction histidine kinase